MPDRRRRDQWRVGRPTEDGEPDGRRDARRNNERSTEDGWIDAGLDAQRNLERSYPFLLSERRSKQAPTGAHGLTLSSDVHVDAHLLLSPSSLRRKLGLIN